jgi:hypothetical protein
MRDSLVRQKTFPSIDEGESDNFANGEVSLNTVILSLVDLRKSYAQAKESGVGSEVDISADCNLKRAVLPIGFPLPEQFSSEAKTYTSLGKDLSAVYLTPVKVREGEWTLMLRGIESETNKEKQTSLHWDGSELITQQRHTVQLLQEVYESLTVGNAITIVNVSTLISPSTGALSAKFPLPFEGKQVNDNVYLGISKGSEHTALTIQKVSDTEFSFCFYSFKGGKAEPEETFAFSNKNVLETHERRSIRSLQEAFTALQTGESSDSIDISSLVGLKHGTLSQRFPCPEPHGQIGETYYCKLGAELAAVHAVISNVGNGVFTIEFTPRLADGTERDTVCLVWNSDAYMTKAEYQVQTVRQQLMSLEVGQSSEVAEFDQLVTAASGVLAGFPAPLKECLSPTPRKDIGLERHDEIERLILTRTGDSEYTCTFQYRRGEQTRKVRLFWLDDSYHTLNQLRAEQLSEVVTSHQIDERRVRRVVNRQSHNPRIKKAFATLGIGERIALGNVNELVYFKTGQLRSSLVTPLENTTAGDELSIGIGSNAENVALEIARVSEQDFLLDFIVENTKESEGRVCTLVWFQDSYMPARDYESLRLREALDSISVGETINIGSARNLMGIPSGVLIAGLPLPGQNNTLGMQRTVGNTGNVHDARLSITQIDKQLIRYDFTTTDSSGEETLQIFFSDGARFRTEIEHTVELIRDAFANAKQHTSVDIGDITCLVGKPAGVLSPFFPPPATAKVLGKQTYFGACEKLTSVELSISKNSEEHLVLTFAHTSEIKEGTQFCELIWDGKSYTRQEDLFIDEFKERLSTLAVGEKLEMDDASPLISIPSGVMSARFPFPNGEGAIGNQFYCGLPKNISKVALAVTRVSAEEYELAIPCVLSDGSAGREGYIRWTGTEYHTREKWERSMLKAAFAELQPGEERLITSVDTLIEKRSGALFKTFPTPAGEKLTGPFYFGASEGIKDISLIVSRTSKDAFLLTVKYSRDIEGAESTERQIVWDGSRYITPLDLKIEAIRELYQQVQTGERKHFGDITSLVYLSAGYFLSGFPTPAEDGKGAHKKRLKVGSNIESVQLDVERLSKEEYWLHLKCTTQESNDSIASSFYWDGLQLWHESDLTRADPVEVHLMKGRIFELALLEQYQSRYGNSLTFEQSFLLNQISGEVRRPDFYVQDVLIDDAKWGKNAQDIVDSALKYDRLRRLGHLQARTSIVCCEATHLRQIRAVLNSTPNFRVETEIVRLEECLERLQVSPDKQERIMSMLRNVRLLVAKGDISQLQDERDALASQIGVENVAIIGSSKIRDEKSWQLHLRDLLRNETDTFLQELENLALHQSPYWEWSYHKRTITMLSMVLDKLPEEDLTKAVKKRIEHFADTMYPGLSDKSNRSLWEKVVRFEKLLAAERIKKDVGKGVTDNELEHSMELRERQMRKLGAPKVVAFDFKAFRKFIHTKSAGLQRGLGELAQGIEVNDFWAAVPRTIETQSTKLNRPAGPAPLEVKAIERTFLESMLDSIKDAATASNALLGGLELLRGEWNQNPIDAWELDSHTLRKRVLGNVVNRLVTECCSTPAVFTRFETLEHWKGRSVSVSADELVEVFQREVGKTSLPLSKNHWTGTSLAQAVLELEHALGLS